jgi:hypothetical protein
MNISTNWQMLIFIISTLGGFILTIHNIQKIYESHLKIKKLKKEYSDLLERDKRRIILPTLEEIKKYNVTVKKIKDPSLLLDSIFGPILERILFGNLSVSNFIFELLDFAIMLILIMILVIGSFQRFVELVIFVVIFLLLYIVVYFKKNNQYELGIKMSEDINLANTLLDLSMQHPDYDKNDLCKIVNKTS